MVRLFTLLLSICSIFSWTISCQVLPMAAWDKDESGRPVQYTSWARFEDTSGWTNPVTYEQVLSIAERCFDYLDTQRFKRTQNGATIVAAWYMPWANRISVSTIPQLTLKNIMTTKHEEAPIWAHNSRGLELLTGLPFHAEDGAMYWGEKMFGSGQPEGSCATHYPDGSIMAVFGRFNSDYERGTPGHEIPPCGEKLRQGGRARNPSCIIVLGRSHVTSVKTQPPFEDDPETGETSFQEPENPIQQTEEQEQENDDASNYSTGSYREILEAIPQEEIDDIAWAHRNFPSDDDMDIDG